MSFIAAATTLVTGASIAAGSAGLAAGAAAATTAAAGITFGEIALGATALAGGVAAYGAYQQGQAQKNMLNYQAQAAGVQQQIAKQTADANITSVQTQAALESKQLSRQQMAIKGAQAASAGAQGINGSVTGAEIAKDTFTKQQMDQQTLLYNANVKSWNITNSKNAELWGLGAQKDQFSMGASKAEMAGDIGAASSLLSSAAQFGTVGTINKTYGMPSFNGY